MIHLSLRPGPAAMTADDSTDVCQTDARTFEILLPVQALKNPKEFVCIIHIKPHAVIADEDDRLGFTLPFAPDFNLRTLSRTGEFQGV